MGNLFKHLRTVHRHRKYVRKMCWKMGLFWQGLTHDLSKYSFVELSICKYYTGKKSPHQVCREKIGYSPSWNHHYHKNKHHFQFWWDEDEVGKIIPVKMPYKYVIESFCDMVGASKAYGGKDWKPDAVWNYWITKCKGKRIMNAESEYLVEKLIWNLYQMGEKHFLDWYKRSKAYLKAEYTSGKLSSEVTVNLE
jgi:hypothetical protein